MEFGGIDDDHDQRRREQVVRGFESTRRPGIVRVRMALGSGEMVIVRSTA